MMSFDSIPKENLELLKFGAESYKRGVQDAIALITPALQQLITNMEEQIAKFDEEISKRGDKRILHG